MELTITEDPLIKTIVSRVTKYDIRQHGPYPETGREEKRAAVLLPLKVENGEVYILLTKRSLGLRAHPGSVSFPGGKRDESDASDIETALREAEEEIGLPREKVHVIGILTRGVTYPNTVVYPVVGIIPSDFDPLPNPEEVDFAFFMPLKDFVEPNKVMYSTMDIRGRAFISRSVQYESGERTANVWGFTANFCTLLAKIVFQDESVLKVFMDSKDDGQKRLVEELEEYFEHLTSAARSKPKSKL